MLRLTRCLLSTLCLLTFATTAAEPDATRHPDLVWVAQTNSITAISAYTGELRQQLPIVHARMLATDPQSGNVWILTDDSLYIANPDGDSLHHAALPVATDIRAMAFDGENRRVYAITDLQLLSWNADHYQLATAALESTTHDIALMDDGSLAILDDNGVLIAEPAGTTQYISTGLPDDARAIAANPEGNGFWVAGQKDIAYFDLANPSAAFTVKHQLNQLNDIGSDGAGGVWLASNQDLVHIGVQGELLLQVDKVGSTGSGKSGGNIIGLIGYPTDGSVWVINATRINRISSNGELLQAFEKPLATGADSSAFKTVAMHYDTTVPEVWITNPEPEIYTNNNRHPIDLVYTDYGSAVATDTIALVIDDALIQATCTVDASAASCMPVDIIDDGYITLSATVQDLAGNVSNPDTIRFTVDTIPPEIFVESPIAELYTNQPSLDVRGKLSEFATLQMNGDPLSIDAGFEFLTNVLLSEGENPLVFIAEDRATNIGTLTRTPVLDSTPPKLVVSAPDDQLATQSNRITVRGHVDEPADVSINGDSITVRDDGSFEYAMTLQEGENLIIVTAEDRAGNRSHQMRNAIYDIAPPEPVDQQLISISEPDSDGNVTITGLPGSVEPGTVITITVQVGVAGSNDPLRIATGDQLFTATGQLAGGTYTFQTVANADGSFLMLVPVDPMRDVIYIELTDTAGNSSGPVVVDIRDIIERSGTLVGALKGEFSVDPTGAANYRLPLSVPQGVGGMQPDLALLYSSRAGDGQLGPGWSLSGLSAISRCAKTVATDGISGGVTYTRDDRFCLDGQRLLLSSGASYGAPGATYHTEIASFQRVTSYGGSLDKGPKYFKVEDKAGLIRYYGELSSEINGRIKLSNADTARLWAVSRIEDRFGNHIDFHYAMSVANAEYIVDHIDWYNRDGTQLGEVKFDYQRSRTDDLSGFLPGGAKSALTQMLSKVTVRAGDLVGSGLLEVGSYQLAYEKDAFAQRMQLSSVQYCAYTGVCLPKTVFRYNDSNVTFDAARAYANQAYDTARHVDFDKDGRIDSVWQRDGSVHLQMGTGGKRDTNIPMAKAVRDRYTFMDLNGDGYLDLVKPGVDATNAYWTIHLWNKNSASWNVAPAESFTAAAGEVEQTPMAVDFDGDGNQELLVRFKISSIAHPVLTIIDFDDEVPVGNKVTYLPFQVAPEQKVHPIEYNGDGRPDLFIEGEGCGSSFASVLDIPIDPDDGSGGGSGGGDTGGGDTGGGSGGDTPSEFLPCGQTAGVLLNLDTGFEKAPEPEDETPEDETVIATISPMLLPECDPRDPDPAPICEDIPGGNPGGGSSGGSFAPGHVKMVDVNNDGLTDMLRYTGGMWRLVLNTGGGWQEYWSGISRTLSDDEFDRTTVADINNDGLVDLVVVDGDAAHLYIGRGNSFANSPRKLPYKSSGFQLTDVNSDGLIDVLYYASKDWQVRYGEGHEPGQMTQFADGYGEQTEILYAPLMASYVKGVKTYLGRITDNADIDKASGDHQVDFSGPLQVVSAFAIDSAAATPIFTWYRYFGARIETRGRGFLGFREVIAYNENTGIQTVNRHRQAFPYIGMVEESRQLIPDRILKTVTEQARDEVFRDPCVAKPWICDEVNPIGDPLKNKFTISAEITLASDFNGKLLAHTVNSFGKRDYSASTAYQAEGLFPFVSASETRSYDYHSGNLVRTETNAMSYADFGNVHKVTVTTEGAGDTHVITTTNSYSDNVAKWCLGRLTNATVKHDWQGQSATRTSSFIYDMAGNCQLTDEILEPNGNATVKLATHYEHDRFGNTLSKTVTGHDGDGPTTRATSTEYDDTGRFPEVMRNAFGHTETYIWNSRLGVKTDMIGPNGIASHWDHDEVGRIVTTQTGIVNGAPTRVVNVTRAWCEEESCASADGQYQVTTNDTAGNIGKTVYDRLQREIRTVTHDHRNHRIVADKVYDLRGRVIAQSLPVDQASGSRCWIYTEHDNLDRVIGRYAPASEAACDNAKRPTLESAQALFASPPADYLVSRTVYAGLTTWTQAPNGRVQSRTVHANGWLKELAESSGTQLLHIDNLPSKASQGGITLATRYAYDAQGNTTAVTDPMGNTLVMSYDRRGRKLGMDDPDMGHWDYQYNAYGELIEQRDAKDQTSTLRYDALGRMISRVEPEGETTWHYDSAEHGLGKLARVSAPGDFVEAYQYDDHGRPSRTVRLIDGQLYWMSTDYDAFGRVKTTRFPSLTAPEADIDDDLLAIAEANDHPGAITRNTYTKDRLTRITDGQGALLWQLTNVDAAGRASQHRLGNGLTEQHTSDLARGTLTRADVRSNTQALQRFDYQWDEVGNLTERRDILLDTTETFHYDSLDRLKTSELALDNNKVIAGAIATTQQYDAIGNLKAKGSAITGYRYGEDDNGILRKPHAVNKVTVNGATKTYRYDANGNLIQSGMRTIDWTSYNKPLAITDGANTSRFSYGPDRARYRHTRTDSSGTATTTYIGGAYERIEQAGKDTLHRYNIHAGNHVIAVKEITTKENDDATTLSFATRYLHRDHLGSVTLITDNDGGVIERLSYDAWGQRQNTQQLAALASTVATDLATNLATGGGGSSGITTAGTGVDLSQSLIATVFQPKWQGFHRGYTGHEMLDHLNLIHMNGRIYDPQIGRFLSADPFVQFPESTQGFNRYAYVGNNPLSYTDPSGYFSWKKALKTIAGVVASIALGPVVGGAILGYLSTGSLEGAVLGMFAGMIAMNIGAGAELGTFGTGGTALFAKSLVHGVTQGILSKAGGGRFGDGFIGGFTGSLSGAIPLSKNPVVKLIQSAALGGTVAKIGGGNFANGAISAAYVTAFNDLMHPSEASQPKLDSSVCSQAGFECEAQPIQENLEKVASDKVIIGVQQSEAAAMGERMGEALCTLVPTCVSMRVEANLIEVNVDLHRVREVGTVIVTHEGKYFGSFDYRNKLTSDYIEVANGSPYTRPASTLEAPMTSFTSYPTKVDWSAHVGYQIPESNIQRRSW